MSLIVEHLRVTRGGKPTLRLEDVRLERGEVLGLIGPSGSGKSTTARALLNLPEADEAIDVHATVEGVDLFALRRGADIGLIFQDPLRSFNPLFSVGDHALEALRHHKGLTKAAAWAEVKAAFARVGLPEDDAFLRRFPHELSGGQRQRAAIAGAIALKPEWLIADEPTSALDTLAQAHVAELLKSLATQEGIGLIFISHDLGLVARLAGQVIVLSAGEAVERGEVADILARPQHEVTRALIAAARAPDFAEPVTPGPVVLEARAVTRRYRRKGPEAVSGVSLSLRRGECLGIAGESGSGKSTLLRTLLALEAPQGGGVYLDGRVFTGARVDRRKIQAVFQDPAASFNPRWDVKRIVAEPLALLETPLSADEVTQRVEAALQAAGLPREAAGLLPHQFSGGQKQKIALARALILRPEIIVLDEAVAALDTVSRGEVLSQLQTLKQRDGVALVFVSHDLAAVRAVADRVLILKDGVAVEEADVRTLFTAPAHPYTQALLAASSSLSGKYG